MSGTQNFGGASVESYTDTNVGTVVTYPQRRICSDGVNGPSRITNLEIWVRSTVGVSNVFFFLSPAASGAFNIDGSTSLKSAGIQRDFLNGGSAATGVATSQGIGFLRSSGGGVTTDDDGDSYAGILGGRYNWVESPSNPTITSVVSNPDGTAATVSYSAPADNGGLAITGYKVQRATNAAFTSGVSTIGRTASQFSAVVTGLTPGVTYYYRVTASNNLTDSVGVQGGTWSTTVMLTQIDSGKAGRQYRGGVWVSNAGKRWSGSVWQDVEGRRWNGSTWQDLGD